MALVTTAGAADADSYASLVEATAYLTTARGVAAWAAAANDTLREQALRRATTYLDNQYRGRWVGVRTNETQALAWPRIDGYRNTNGGFVQPLYDLDDFQIDEDVVPQQVKNACMEAALLSLAGVSMEPRLARGGAIKSEQVGPLAVTHMDGASVLDRITVIEGLLRGLVKSMPGASSGTVALVRA